MTVVLDSSFVAGLMTAADANHAAAVQWLNGIDEDLVTSPLAIAEMDAIAARGGRKAQQALWANLDSGAFTVRWWADALAETLQIARRHPQLSLTAASLVAVATRVGSTRIASFDEQFRSVTTAGGENLTVLPSGA